MAFQAALYAIAFAAKKPCRCSLLLLILQQVTYRFSIEA
jgi:hypothetical protein